MELYLAELSYSDSKWNVNLLEYIEEYVDIIWTKRWQSYGDCILNVPIDTIKSVTNYSDLIGKLLVLRSDTSDNLSVVCPDDYMIIEKITFTYDAYANEILVIEGNDLVSILGRRIIWGQSSFRSSQTLKNACDTLVTNAIISPSDSNRKINAFAIGTYTASTTFDVAQRTFDNLYETIIEICEDNYSPDVILDSGVLKFILYSGTDRTLTSANPLVFSEQMDNLEKYEYLKDVAEYKNAWLCAGEGEGINRIYVGNNTADAVGLARRELYIDARDISRQDDNGEIPLTTYKNMLQTRIQDKKLETWIKEACTAELTFNAVKYGVDYSIGDKATLIDPKGQARDIRITEFIRSNNSEGYSEYPNFELIGG